jgi:hypothetical protein
MGSGIKRKITKSDCFSVRFCLDYGQGDAKLLSELRGDRGGSEYFSTYFIKKLVFTPSKTDSGDHFVVTV